MSLGPIEHIKTTLNIGLMAVLLAKIEAGNGVLDVKAWSKMVWLGIRQLLWIHDRLILMSFTDLCPLGP